MRCRNEFGMTAISSWLLGGHPKLVSMSIKKSVIYKSFRDENRMLNRIHHDERKKEPFLFEEWILFSVFKD